MSKFQNNNVLVFDESAILKVSNESYIIMTVLDIFDMEGRQACKWLISDKGEVISGSAGNEDESATGDYIWSGARGVGATPLQYASSMLSYLGAFAESRDEGGENFDLFASGLRTWAESNSDEFSMLSWELENCDGVE